MSLEELPAILIIFVLALPILMKFIFDVVDWFNDP